MGTDSIPLDAIDKLIDFYNTSVDYLTMKNRCEIILPTQTHQISIISRIGHRLIYNFFVDNRTQAWYNYTAKVKQNGSPFSPGRICGAPWSISEISRLIGAVLRLRGDFMLRVFYVPMFYGFGKAGNRKACAFAR